MSEWEDITEESELKNAEAARVKADSDEGWEDAPEASAPGDNAVEVNDSPAMDALENAWQFFAGVGSGIPAVGPLVDKLAKTELVSGRKGGMTDEQYDKLVAKGGRVRKAGNLAGTLGGFAAAPAAVLPQLGLSGADMASRKFIGGEDISGAKAGGTLAIEGALGSAGKAMNKLGVTSKILDKVKGIQEKMVTKAGKQAEAAAGLTSTKSLRDKLSRMEADGSVKPGELGNRLIQDGVVQAGDTAASVAKKSKDLFERAGKEIDQLMGGKSVSTQKVQDALLDTLDTPAYTELREKVIKKVKKQKNILFKLTIGLEEQCKLLQILILKT